MDVMPVLAVSFIMRVVSVLFVLCAVILVLVILLQKGRGGGLGSAFGGAGAGSLLGSKTGDFLTWVTIVLVTAFLLLAVVMAKYYRPDVKYAGPEETPAETRQPEEPAATPNKTPATGDLDTDSSP